MGESLTGCLLVWRSLCREQPPIHWPCLQPHLLASKVDFLARLAQLSQGLLVHTQYCHCFCGRSRSPIPSHRWSYLVAVYSFLSSTRRQYCLGAGIYEATGQQHVAARCAKFYVGASREDKWTIYTQWRLSWGVEVWGLESEEFI